MMFGLQKFYREKHVFKLKIQKNSEVVLKFNLPVHLRSPNHS